MYKLLANDGHKFYHIDFQRINYFQDYDPESLKDIILFTTSFSTINRLELFLKENNILPNDVNINNFEITYTKGDKTSTILNNIPLKKDISLFKFDNLLRVYKKEIQNKDFYYFFIKHYYNKLKNVSVFIPILKELYSGYKYYEENYKLKEETYYFLEEFITKYATRNGIINLTRMTELIIFITENKGVFETKDVVDEIKTKKEELNHYKELLNNVSEDEHNIYENKIKELEQELGGR